MPLARVAPLLVLALAAAACTPAQSPTAGNATDVPAGSRVAKLSIHGMDCAECVGEIERELRKEGALHKVVFDKKRVVLEVVIAQTVTDQQLIAAIERAGFKAELGDKGGSWLAQEATPDGADVVTVIKDGSDVADLATLAVAGKVTVVDFYAEWCGPCRKVDAHVKKTLAARTDVAYRRLDVVDWDSPLAKHYMKDVSELPYVVVFGKKGARVDAIAGLDLKRLDAAIEKGAGP